MEKSRVRDYLIEFIKKPLPPLVKRELKVADTRRRIVSIIGPRRAGKTYYFYQLLTKIKEKSLYLNFEDTRLIDVNFKQVRELIRLYQEIKRVSPQSLFLDEIQNIKNWELAVREILDRQKYKIFLTGSSSKLLSREMATSLRGRSFSYLLLPFSFSEYLKAKNISLKLLSRDEEAGVKAQLREYLELGGFPEVVFEKEKERVLKEFYDLILFRDVVERHHLRNISLAKFLLAFLAQNFAKEMSVNKIYHFLKSQGKKFSKNTLYDYVEKMQDSVAIFFLNRYSEKIYERESWPKKVYLCDMGLTKVVRFSRDFGKLMENCVFLELLRRTNEEPLLEIYYYKNPQGKEVDFLLKEGARVKQLIQVCWQFDEETKKRELGALMAASKETNCRSLLVITWDDEGEEEWKKRKVKYVPLWRWLTNRPNPETQI